MNDDGSDGSAVSRGLVQPTLRIVKLTPIALSFCDLCDMEFRSKEPIEDDAEAEMKKAFEAHNCFLNESDRRP